MIHKALRFGIDDVFPACGGSTNREKLRAEMHDLQALLFQVCDSHGILLEPKRIAAKLEKVAKWMAHSEAKGKLQKLSV